MYKIFGIRRFNETRSSRLVLRGIVPITSSAAFRDKRTLNTSWKSIVGRVDRNFSRSDLGPSLLASIRTATTANNKNSSVLKNLNSPRTLSLREEICMVPDYSQWMPFPIKRISLSNLLCSGLIHSSFIHLETFPLHATGAASAAVILSYFLLEFERVMILRNIEPLRSFTARTKFPQ